MPYAIARDNTRLHYDESGKGTALIFVHEFSGDARSWEAQMRFFSRRYRCIAFNARGYPPSEVPQARSKYSWRIAVDDIADVLRHLGIRKAHVVGCSMGAYSALQFGMRHPAMALSVTTLGAGAGSDPATRKAFLKTTESHAQLFETAGTAAALKQRGVQAKRPPVYDLETELRKFRPPLLVMCGNEDDGSIGPALFIKRVCRNARLWICPASGHTLNTEEPELFNRSVLDFLTLVDNGRWSPRDPRSISKSA